MSADIPAAQRAVRQEVVRVGASLFQRGYVHSTAGNISVRLGEQEGGGHLITPTDACLGFLDADALAWVDDQGRQLSGAIASKTLQLHRVIYAATERARCVLHTHSSHLVALTLQGVWRQDDVLPPLTAYQLMKVGHVPLVAHDYPGSPHVAQEVKAAIGRAERPLHAVMLDRLGPVVWHASPAQAMALLEELEETAKLWLLAQQRAPQLEPQHIAVLQARFNTLW